MTNAEFQNNLKKLCALYPCIGEREKKTVNELFWILSQDNGVTDYNITLFKAGEAGVVCIPSAKTAFIPIDILEMHVKEVECEEEDYGFDGLCLNVYVEE